MEIVEPFDIRTTQLKIRSPSIRWRTSNMEYGKFYLHAALEAQRNQSLHAECEKQREALNNELIRCKTELERLRLQSSRDLASAPCNVYSNSESSETQELSDNSNSIRNAENNPGQKIKCPKEKNTEMDQSTEYRNAGDMTEVDENAHGSPQSSNDTPEKPEKTVNPIKVRRFKPRIFPLVRDDFQPPSSGNITANKLSDGASAMPKSKSPQMPKKQQNKFSAIHSGVHPATRKHELYKYYGFAGQEAKTSCGHNLPLGVEPPYERKARRFLT